MMTVRITPDATILPTLAMAAAPPASCPLYTPWQEIAGANRGQSGHTLGVLLAPAITTI